MLSASRSCPNTGSWKQTLAWLSRNRALLVTWNATPHVEAFVRLETIRIKLRRLAAKHLVTNLHFPDGQLCTLKYVSDQKIR